MDVGYDMTADGRRFHTLRYGEVILAYTRFNSLFVAYETYIVHLL